LAKFLPSGQNKDMKMNSQYNELKNRIAKGWNTWNTRSVLSHVLLPEAFAINLCLKEYVGRQYLKEALIGRHNESEERIFPGPHAYDGSFSELRLLWQGIEVTVQSAHKGKDLVILVTPLSTHKKTPLLVVETGILWNRSGYVRQKKDYIQAKFNKKTIKVYATRESVFDPYLATQTPHFSIPLDGLVGISTGKPRSIEKIQAIIERQKAVHEARAQKYGELAEVYKAIQTCMAWDTIYEPEHNRVVSPVSRIWNVVWGGFVLFDWDTYFAATMAGMDHKDLAYANAIEMTRDRTEAGFVPNFSTVANIKSRDRSEPPVGSICCWELFKRFGDVWFLEEVFDGLLEWNRWWNDHRQWKNLLCWGSDPYEPVSNAYFELESSGVYDRQGAAYESGLDNSPMYDDIPFDSQNHLMKLADVGLTGMYIADCEALANIAKVLGRKKIVRELSQRAETYRQALKGLWDEKSGMFLNQHTDTNEFSHRISHTNFYALLAKAASPEQAQRMISQHFYNPEEFWGEWIIPTIARNDPAYPDQEYWRGRIWGPSNFLVYLSLKNYELGDAVKDLSEKSKALLMKNWLENGFVCENYCADNGVGGERPNSDRYYHWGGLLGMPALMEAGYFAPKGKKEPQNDPT
jgi:putative isomerase